MVIEMLPAGRGDCLLVHCPGPDDTAAHLLVDGGIGATFDNVLAARLSSLADAGHRLDLAVVSHIDSDHIGGIIKLIAANGSHSEPAVIEIGDVWHNSYRHLIMGGRPATEDERSRVERGVQTILERADGPVSGKEGSALAALLKRGGYPWNAALEGGAITGPSSSAVAISPTTSITVLGPTDEHLKALEKVWRRELMKLGVAHDATQADEFEEAFERVLLARYDRKSSLAQKVSGGGELDAPKDSDYQEDTSRTNASSLTFLLTNGDRRGTCQQDWDTGR